MTDHFFSIDDYLERIQYKGELTVCHKTLLALHRAHTLTIPFENLNIFMGRKIVLDKEALFKKIVHEKRGGYCFEMNALFCMVLEKLGFQVTNLLARVFEDGIVPSPKSHQVLLVNIEGKQYIADVGFGGNGLIAPILLQQDAALVQYSDTFRIIMDDTFGYILQHLMHGEFQNKYTFTLEACLPYDYEIPNFYCSVSPDSIFTQHRICTKPTKEGRVTLNDMNLSIRTKEGTQKRKIQNNKEYCCVLKEYFGIEIHPDLFLREI